MANTKPTADDFNFILATDVIPLDDVIERLRVHILTKYKRQAAAARAWGVSGSHVSAVLNGIKRPNDLMLSEIGVVAEKMTIYLPASVAAKREAA